MNTATAAPEFRYIGITDETTVCEECGKPELKATVVLAVLDADGNTEDVVRYGSSCAAKALSIAGGGARVRKAAEGATVRTMIAADDAIKSLTSKNLDRDGRPSALAVKLGMAEALLASVDPELVAQLVAAVRDAEALGETNPRGWLKRHGYV